MSGYLLSTYFYLRHGEEARNRETVLSFLSAIASYGYHIAGDITSSLAIDNVWYYTLYDSHPERIADEEESHVDVDALFIPGTSITVREKIDAFLAGKSYDLFLRAYSVAREGDLKGHVFSLVFSPDEGNISIDCDTDDLRIEAVKQKWESILTAMYRIWHPLYAFPWLPNLQKTERDEIRDMQVRWLYDINYWGPEIVNHLGREHTVATPYAIIEPMDDGGVFVKPTDRVEAAAYFGISLP